MALQTIAISAKTPMGVKDGELRIEVSGGTLTGEITMMGNTTAIENGVIDAEGNFEFDSPLNTPMGSMPSHTTGTFKDGVVNAKSKSKVGTFEVTSK